MSELRFIVCLMVIAALSCKPETDSSESLFSLKLSMVTHEEFPLSALEKNKASVVIFLQPECPFCNSYAKTLRHLDSVFSAKEVQMYGVMAGTNYSDSELVAYRDDHNLRFPFLLDPEFELTKRLKATITPQAFLIDGNGRVVYHGMIDNWGYELGKTRARATEFYLTDAVNHFLEGKLVAPDSTKAIGCYIQ
jgi:peroxiredoxin